MDNTSPNYSAPNQGDALLAKSGEKQKKKKKLGTSRGIETLFRNTYRVHVEVSALADSKANFLISVNSIIMILIVSHGMKYVGNHTALLLPIGIVMATSIGSMIFAVLVARPRINKGNASSTMMERGGSNLLFFGTFTQLTKERFITDLSEMLVTPTELYPAMMGDIYEMGLVLRKKFRRLQIAYGFLLYGMPTGVIIFVIMQSSMILNGEAGSLVDELPGILPAPIPVVP